MMKIEVCVGSACHLKGSYNVISELSELIEEKLLGDKIEVCAVFCLSHCTEAVSVRVDDGEIYSVSCKNVCDFFDNVILPRLRA